LGCPINQIGTIEEVLNTLKLWKDISDKQEDKEPLSTEMLLMVCKLRGITVAEMDLFSIGFLLNYIDEHDSFLHSDNEKKTSDNNEVKGAKQSDIDEMFK
jgi:hypothetical protein